MHRKAATQERQPCSAPQRELFSNLAVIRPSQNGSLSLKSVNSNYQDSLRIFLWLRKLATYVDLRVVKVWLCFGFFFL